MFKVTKKTSYQGIVMQGYTGPRIYLDKGGEAVHLMDLFNKFRGRHIKITIEEVSTVIDK
jgi:hypothetical protein